MTKRAIIRRLSPPRAESIAPSPCPPDAMPSFDVVSEVDKYELTNAVDQASRELTNPPARSRSELRKHTG
jgi:hypothetical protein